MYRSPSIIPRLEIQKPNPSQSASGGTFRLSDPPKKQKPPQIYSKESHYPTPVTVTERQTWSFDRYDEMWTPRQPPPQDSEVWQAPVPEGRQQGVYDWSRDFNTFVPVISRGRIPYQPFFHPYQREALPFPRDQINFLQPHIRQGVPVPPHPSAPQAHPRYYSAEGMLNTHQGHMGGDHSIGELVGDSLARKGSSYGPHSIGSPSSRLPRKRGWWQPS